MEEHDRKSESIEGLVEGLRERRLSRKAFVASLAGLGVTTTGITALIASAGDSEHQQAAYTPSAAHTAQLNQQLHQEHIERQAGATQPASEAIRAQRVREILSDYADDAVVEDPMFARPIVGRAAIAQRKLAEMNAMAGVSIEVTNRFAHGNQVVVEWVMRGRHQGDFFGYRASGRDISQRGVTVVTRENGKIVRESLHYDLGELHRLLAGPPLE